jgi:signal transduction histidine kinase
MQGRSSSTLVPGSWILAAILVGLNLLILGMALTSQRQGRQQAEAYARVNSLNLAKLLESSLEGQIRSIDQALQSVNFEIAQDKPSGEILPDRLAAFIEENRRLNPLLDALRVSGPDGMILHHPRLQPNAGASIADRDYFQALKSNRNAGLVISKPVLGVISHKWIIILARRFETPDGHFGGVTYGTVTLEAFGEALTRVDPGPTGSIALLDGTLALLVRYPFANVPSDRVGERRTSPTLEDILRNGRTSGTYTTHSASDNVVRTYSFRKIGSNPLYVFVGLAANDYLLAWRQELRKTWEAAALFSLLSLVLGLLLLRSQAQLAHHRSDLERQVVDRTLRLSLANEDLSLAKDRAEAANRAKSAFLANMSHELRTPLNAILLYSELIQNDAKDSGIPSMAADASHVATAGRNLLNLITNILDMAKIEAGKMILDREPFKLPELLRTCLSTVGELANRGGNAVSLTCEPGIPGMVGDPTKVRQVVLNLLSNACKFTQDGTIQISAGPGPAPGWVHITIRDTGIGIAPEDQERIFEEFVQGDRESRLKYGGTGLGLALSRRFCQLMGGEVRVESSPGQGTAFTVLLPAQLGS